MLLAINGRVQSLGERVARIEGRDLRPVPKLETAAVADCGPALRRRH